MISAKKVVVTSISILLSALPGAVRAQQLIKTKDDDFAALVSNILAYSNLIFGLITSAVVLVIIYGLMKFIGSAGSAKDYSEGRSIVVAGIIGLIVLSTIWGLVAFLANTLN